MGGCGKDYTRSSGELLSPPEHVAAPGADGHPSGSSLVGIRAAPVGMDQCAPQGLCSHGHSAELLEVRVNGQGGRGMPILPLSHAGSCHICLRLAGNSFLWSLLLLLVSAPAPLCSQALKPLPVPQRGECEMSSDRSLQELHTSKWVKAAAKNIITKCLFSLYFQDKIWNIENTSKSSQTDGICNTNCSRRM